MRIKLLSDLHLEERNKIPDNILEPDDVLILAGDIGDPFSGIYENFLTKCRSLYDIVFVIPGNHEFYNHVKSTIKYNKKDIIYNETEKKYPEYLKFFRNRIYSYEQCLMQMKNVCDKTGCVFLYRNQYEYKDTVFIGTVFWSIIEDEYEHLLKDHNIYKTIFYKNEFLNFDNYNKLANEDLEWLTEKIRNIDKDKVVITHIPPVKEMTSEIFNGNIKNKLYYNKSEDLLTNSVKLWVSGHTHVPMMTRVNNTTLFSNPYGNSQETLGYDKHKTFVL